MRILILSNLLPPKVLGGYEIACFNVAQALVARGHDVRVLTSFTEIAHHADPDWVDRTLALHWFQPYETGDGPVTNWRVHQASCAAFENTARLIAVLRDFRPDVVYVWNILGVGSAGLLGALNAADIPWTIHLMDRVPEPIATNMPPLVASVFGGTLHDLFAPAHVITMSQHLLDDIAETTGLEFHGDVEMVPGWMEMPEPRPHGPYRRGGITRFVTAGVMLPHKGIHLIIEAAGRLRAERKCFEVAMYGSGDIAPYVDLVSAHGATSVVQMHGPRPQSELFAIYAESDAFLFPTWEREPFGFAPIEAAGSAMPPIMTRNCGAAERLVDEVHCIKIDRDVESLLAAMRRIVDGEVDLARMGRAGAATVRQDMSLSRCMDRIEAVLDRCARRPTDRDALDDPRLEQLAYLQDMLAVQMRFG